jgi:hypothetical protein
MATTGYYASGGQQRGRKFLLPTGLLLEVDAITDNTPSWGCFVTPAFMGDSKEDVHEPKEV